MSGEFDEFITLLFDKGGKVCYARKDNLLIC
jgi:hypothetical protein